MARVEGSQELWGQQGAKESLRHLEPQKPPNFLEAWWVPASLLIPGRLHQGLHESALVPPDSLGLVTTTGACCQHTSLQGEGSGAHTEAPLAGEGAAGGGRGPCSLWITAS